MGKRSMSRHRLLCGVVLFDPADCEPRAPNAFTSSQHRNYLAPAARSGSCPHLGMGEPEAVATRLIVDTSAN